MANKEVLEKFLTSSLPSLERIAYRTIQMGYPPDKILVFSIDLEDHRWDELVKLLTPDQNMEPDHKIGKKSVLIGCQTDPSFVKYLCSEAPDLEEAFSQELPQGLVRAVTLTGGFMTYSRIEPKPSLN